MNPKILIKSIAAIFSLLAIVITTAFSVQRSTPLATVSLAWDASTDPTRVGYNVYYGTSSGNYTKFCVNRNQSYGNCQQSRVGYYLFLCGD